MHFISVNPYVIYSFIKPLRDHLRSVLEPGIIFLLKYLPQVAHSNSVKLCILMQDLFTCQKLFWMEAK